MQQFDEFSSIPRSLPIVEPETLIHSNPNEYDLDIIEELGQAPSIEAYRLFKNAAQRRHLSGYDLTLARAAREEIKQRARIISELIEKVNGLSLTTDECSVLQPPYGRSTHLPSPDRPYVHMAVHTGQGGVSVTPLWASTIGGSVAMSTVENRIKARATAIDPLVALSVSAGVGSQISYEIGGFAKQSPDPERKLIRTLAGIYSKPKIDEQTDGNYTSWDQREQNERIRLDIQAYRIRNELGDGPVYRSAPHVQALAPRFSNATLPRPSERSSNDRFWGTSENFLKDDPRLYKTRDELAILGMTRQGKEKIYRSLNPTYGHLACFDQYGLLRCLKVGFDVINIKGEARISFLINKHDAHILQRNPAIAMSVTKYNSGSVWLQSQGLIQFHEDSGAVRDSIRRLEGRYNRVHHRLALDLNSRDFISEDYVLATLSHQRISSRYRESERSLRSANTHGK